MAHIERVATLESMRPRRASLYPATPASGIIGRMKVWLDVPDALAEQLAGGSRDVSRAALEALAADAYRAHRLSGVEVCRLLDIPSRTGLDVFLKSHGVPLDYSIDDFEREGETSARLRQQRQAELAHPPNH